MQREQDLQYERHAQDDRTKLTIHQNRFSNSPSLEPVCFIFSVAKKRQKQHIKPQSEIQHHTNMAMMIKCI
jgi:hypothetical protein